jgi:DNA-binding transcriptional LysR family regulator
MDIPWDDMRLFLAVAEAGSLSGAARRLRMTQPTVSRRVAELEATLGEPLFVRTADGASLTSFGERLVEPARRMAEGAAELTRAAEGAESEPQGVVRITAPPGIAVEVGAPFAAWLRTKLPRVRIEILSTIAYLDLSRREADLAIRMSPPTQRDLVTLTRLDVDVAPHASEAYVRTLPRGYGPADVAWIGWAPPFDQMSPNRELGALLPGWTPVFASDDFLVQLRAAEAGIGAIFLGRTRHRFSPPTSLVELELDLGEIKSALHLVAAKSALAIPRVRAVAELLAAEIQGVTKLPKDRARRGR